MKSIRTLFAAASLLISTIAYSQDTTPPIFDDYDMEIDIECSDLDQVYVTATDDSGEDVVITYSDAAFSGGCTDNIIRTYTATDPSGNTSTTIQILVVVDNTPPVFLGVGEHMVISCEMEVPEIPEATAYDECSDMEISEVSFESSFEDGECVQIITWTWGATDECGNYGEHTKTITIVDETAPEFTDTPDSYYIGCEEDYPAAPAVTATDNCNDLEITLEEEIIEGGIGEGAASYCTAMDVTYNNHSFSMKLINSPAFENYNTSDLVFTQMPDMGSGATAILSGNVYAEDNPNAGWYIHMEFEDGMNWEEWSSQDFPTSYHDDLELAGETHVDWTYFMMNGENSYMMGLGDYANSELQLTHTPGNYYYGFQLGFGGSGFNTAYGFSGWFHADGMFYDAASSDPEIVNGVEYSFAGDIYTELRCCPVESLIRTWTATDACDNVSEIQQVITKIDVLAPTFTYVPEDLLLECSDEIPMEMAEATDNCGEPEVTVEDVVEPTLCDSEYTIYRTFTATDNCGLHTEATQIITVVDTQAPVLSSTPGDMVIDCDAEVPAAPVVSATDNCDDEVEVMYTEEIVGDVAPEGSMAYCAGTTPVDFEAGWSGIFFDEVLGDVLVETVVANYVQYPDVGDGYTATIYAELISVDNENAGWSVELNLQNGMNWDDWSNQTFPTSYKDDLGTAGDLYLDWTYFILESGSLEGWGDWEGSSISVVHAPVNHYYGFQLGVQAANVNGEYGIGGWVSYSGTMINGNGETILVDGAGDFAFDLDCCPRYSVVRTWEAEDCAGNSVSHTQTISFDQVEAEETPGTPESEAEAQVVSLQGKSLEDLVTLNMNPNPVISNSKLELSSDINIGGIIEVYNSQGLKVRTVWEGKLESDTEKEFAFNKGNLTSGVYIAKVITASGEVTHKFIVE